MLEKMQILGPHPPRSTDLKHQQACSETYVLTTGLMRSVVTNQGRMHRGWGDLGSGVSHLTWGKSRYQTPWEALETLVR